MGNSTKAVIRFNSLTQTQSHPIRIKNFINARQGSYPTLSVWETVVRLTTISLPRLIYERLNERYNKGKIKHIHTHKHTQKLALC